MIAMWEVLTALCFILQDYLWELAFGSNWFGIEHEGSYAAVTVSRKRLLCIVCDQQKCQHVKFAEQLLGDESTAVPDAVGKLALILAASGKCGTK